MIRRMICLRRVSVLVLLLSALGALAEPVKVTVRPPRVRTELFDPQNPPPQRPQMNEGEAAVTASRLGASAGVKAQITRQEQGEGTCRATARIESVEVTTELEITLWLPQDYTEKLKDHEQGHRRIAEHFYKDAGAIVRRLARPFVGQTIAAEASDCSSAADAALREAAGRLNARIVEALQTQVVEAQRIYDELTDHGRNEVPEQQAVRQAIRRASGKN